MMANMARKMFNSKQLIQGCKFFMFQRFFSALYLIPLLFYTVLVRSWVTVHFLCPSFQIQAIKLQLHQNVGKSVQVFLLTLVSTGRAVGAIFWPFFYLCF